MDFTIIVPTFNSQRYIGQCLESIISQKHNGETQIIVVDNLSTDNTLEISRNLGVEIISEKDNGEPDAINKGMKLAKGDIVAWLDSDDLYEPNALSIVESAFDRQKNLDWVYGKAYFLDSDGGKIRRLITMCKELLQKNYDYDKLCSLCFIPQPSVFMLRSFYKMVGDLNTDYKLIFDYEYWLRAGLLSTPMFIPEYLSSMRAHNGSLSVQYSMTQMKQSLGLATRFKPNSILTYSTRFLILASTLVYYRTIGKYF